MTSENEEIRLRSWGMTDGSAWRVTLDQGDQRVTINVRSKAEALALVAAIRAAMLSHANNYTHEIEDVA